MSTQAGFYPPETSLEASVVHPSWLLGNSFAPEFLSLALLDKGNHYGPEVPMSSVSSSPTNIRTANAQVNPNMQGPRTRSNRQLKPAPRPASRRQSIDVDMHQAQLRSYQPVGGNLARSSFSSSEDQDHPDFGFEPQHSDRSSMQSSSSSPPTRRHSQQHDETLRREKHLERNRAAASKSRQKKKRETDQLKNRYQEVSRKKQELEEEIKGLHSKLLYYKDQILMHSQCDDEAIRLYLGQMVKQATQNEAATGAATDEGGRSVSPQQQDGMSMHGHGHAPALGLTSPQQLHLHRMEDPMALPCGNEKSIMNDMMCTQPSANVFDYQIRIS